MTFSITYIFTGSIIISSSVSVVELVIKPLAYFTHEHMWDRWIKHKE